jgi:hypothetical protein
MESFLIVFGCNGQRKKDSHVLQVFGAECLVMILIWGSTVTRYLTI